MSKVSSKEDEEHYDKKAVIERSCRRCMHPGGCTAEPWWVGEDNYCSEHRPREPEGMMGRLQDFMSSWGISDEASGGEPPSLEKKAAIQIPTDVGNTPITEQLPSRKEPSLRGPQRSIGKRGRRTKQRAGRRPRSRSRKRSRSSRRRRSR